MLLFSLIVVAEMHWHVGFGFCCTIVVMMMMRGADPSAFALRVPVSKKGRCKAKLIAWKMLDSTSCQERVWVII